MGNWVKVKKKQSKMTRKCLNQILQNNLMHWKKHRRLDNFTTENTAFNFVVFSKMTASSIDIINCVTKQIQYTESTKTLEAT